MPKLLFVLLSCFFVNVSFADDKGESKKDPLKFCVYAGKEYSVGSYVKQDDERIHLCVDGNQSFSDKGQPKPQWELIPMKNLDPYKR